MTAVPARAARVVHHPRVDDGRGRATIAIDVRDRRLGRAIERSVAEALEAAERARPAEIPRVVAFRTHARLERLEASSALQGAVAVLEVTRANRRRLAAYADRARAAGATDVQLVWDGIEPSRAAVGAHVFAALEHARAARPPGSKGPSIYLASTAALCRAISTRREETR